ncbi:hypothetical protein ES703_112474 [subsurface metagenome]
MFGATVHLLRSAGTFSDCVAEKVTFVLLCQLDLVMTALAVHLGFYELNPVVRSLLTVPLLLVFIKCAIPLLIAWLAPGRLLLPAIAFLLLVVGWNTKELLMWLV